MGVILGFGEMLNMGAGSLEDIRIGELIDEFIDECRIKNLSPKSVDWYTVRLGKFFEDMMDGELASLTVGAIKHRLAEMLETRKAATVNGYIGAVKTMLNYALDVEYPVQFSPRRLKKMRVPKELPPTLTVEQIEEMLRQPDQKKFHGIRNFTIMSLLLDVGLRLSEVTGLTVKDVQMPYLTVHGKGRKDRIVAMSDAMVKRLRKYLRVRKRTIAEADSQVEALFPSRYGKKLSGRRVNEFLKQYAKAAGITDVRVSTHVWRYTYATMAVRAGMSLTSLQTCLGHTTLSMTRAYVAARDEDAFEEARNCSPLTGFEGR
jgi:integrase/recombinase XerD